MSELYPKDIDAGSSPGLNAKKLFHGRVKIWHTARMVAPYVYKLEGYDTSQLRYGIGLDENDLYLGATKNFPPKVAEKWRSAYKKRRNLRQDSSQVFEISRPQNNFHENHNAISTTKLYI